AHLLFPRASADRSRGARRLVGAHARPPACGGVRQDCGMSAPFRVTFLQTHPIQYMAPWFRYMAAKRPEIALTVLYAAEPTPEQQGTGFDAAFEWDAALRDGYASRVLLAQAPERRFDAGSFYGLDVPEVGRVIAETKP